MGFFKTIERQSPVLSSGLHAPSRTENDIIRRLLASGIDTLTMPYAKRRIGK